MSAFPRVRRSRSKTAPESAAESTHENGMSSHFLRRSSCRALMCCPLRAGSLALLFRRCRGAVVSIKPGRSRGIPPHDRDPPTTSLLCIRCLTDTFLLCRHESDLKGRPIQPLIHALSLSSHCARDFTRSSPREPHKRQRPNAVSDITFKSAVLASTGRGACGQCQR